MLERIKSHLTYANVMSSIAVFLLLGGGAAWAQQQIGANQLQNQAVTAPKVATGAVSSRAIQRGAVRPGHMIRGAVRPAHMVRGAVRPAHIVGGAIFPGHIRDEAVTGSKLADGTVDSAKLADGTVDSDKLADGTTVPGAPIGGAGGALAGSYPDPQLADGAVGSDKLAGDLVVAKGFASVFPSGSIAEARSRNIEPEHVSHVATGRYCFNDLPVDHSRVAIVTIDAGERVATATPFAYFGCPVENRDFSVETMDLDGNHVDASFQIVIF